jgi:II/X family phage/plasmid replication protein
LIDWINAVLPYRHTRPIADGGVQRITPDGEVGPVLPRKLQLRGSHDSGLMIQSSWQHRLSADPDFGSETIPNATGDFTHIWVSGSPKFLQGHNLFGTDNVCRLTELMATQALQLLGREATALDQLRWRKGAFKLTVVDLTEMLDVGSEDDVAAILSAAGDHARMAGEGPQRRTKERCGGTVYWGKRSRRWALKLYSKYLELRAQKKDHQLPREIERRDDLMEYARGCIRAELRLLSAHLKKLGLQSGHAWLNRDARTVWMDHMTQIDWSANAVLTPAKAAKLPKRLRGTYALWEQGHKVEQLLSRATFFRHRKLLLGHGIDITSAPERERAQVVPLVRLIEARPKAIPQWAYNTPLLAA